jgi:hypothetical protein
MAKPYKVLLYPNNPRKSPLFTNTKRNQPNDQAMAVDPLIQGENS